MKFLPVALFLAMGFVIVVLVLNIRDGTRFEGGSLTPPAGPGPDPIEARLLPATISHSCPTCGDCVHPVQILESHRVFLLTNHRPWYKLFWSGDQTLYFEDPVYLAANLHHRAARDPTGEWKVRARVGPSERKSSVPHECGKVPGEFTLTYVMVTSGNAQEDVVLSPRSLRVNFLAYRLDVPQLPSVIYFTWLLESPWTATEDPCSCGKP